MEEPDLENLLHQYRRGDLEALGCIVDRTREPLYRFILGMVRDPHTADDVFQDVWLRAVKGLHRYKSDRLLSWLYRIARNRVIDLSRKRKPDLSIDQPLGNTQEPVTLEAFLASDVHGPDRNARNRELGEQIRQAVALLPPDQREVFMLRTESDLPFKEIALIQNVSINTALARMQYALRRLRESLSDESPSPSQDLT